jgi:hypothetical protein
MANEISEGRKVAYYLGACLQVVGALMFVSVFFTAAANFGDFENFNARAKSEMFRGFGGMSLLVVGAVIRSIGAKGMAGSGVILDPKQAREDLEPYSRMAGGLVKDALDEAEVGFGREPTQVVMVRCPSCRGLNQELAKFCQECGVKL